MLAGVAALALVLAACAPDDGATDPPGVDPPGADAPDGVEEQTDLGSGGVGEPVPDRPLTRLDGDGELSLADLDAPAVVNFWASWCPPCEAEMPDFEQVSRERADEVAFVGINIQDEDDAALQLAERTGVTYPLVRDPGGEWGRWFGVSSMPATYLVDADGQVVHGHAGFIDADGLRDLVDEHLG